MDQGPQSPGARSRAFSFHSDKSGGSKSKDNTESPKDKQRRDSIWKATSKANPLAALAEAQPGANAIFEESTIAPLKSIQHKDTAGNVITDPDLSNPTRPRLERPLDTIKAFERAIDNGYSRRGYGRSESYEQGTQNGGSRRNSGYGYDGAMSPNRFSGGQNGGGYYGGQRDSYGGPANGQQRRYPAQRMASEPMMYGGQRPYPHAYHQSQDTMNTGGSDSTGPWANSTDPSSENSSVERGPTAQKPYGDYPQPGYPQNGYPQNGHGHNGYQNGHGHGGFQGGIPEEGGAYPMGGRAPPVQAPTEARRPIPLGDSGDHITELPSTRRPEPEKRKSWLKRRFSKKD